jgi:hypothetical protein
MFSPAVGPSYPDITIFTLLYAVSVQLTHWCPIVFFFWILSWASSIRAVSSHHVPVRFILTPRDMQTNIVVHFSCLHLCCMFLTCHLSIFNHCNTINYCHAHSRFFLSVWSRYCHLRSDYCNIWNPSLCCTHSITHIICLSKDNFIRHRLCNFLGILQ